MLLLPNGCSCSEITVCPKNWEKSKDTTKDWYIRYVFYDPVYQLLHPNGKPIFVKRGLNYFKDPVQRRNVVRDLLEALRHKLEKEGYNPITDTYKPPVSQEQAFNATLEKKYGISPDTGLERALIKSWERLSGIEYKPAGTRPDWNLWREKASATPTTLELSTIRDLLCSLHGVLSAATILKITDIPVKDISRKYIKMILDTSGKSPNRTNKYRNNLSILFNEMIEMEIIEDNPTEKIKKLKTVKKPKEKLSLAERRTVDEKLRKANPAFHRFTNIFYHSGARKTELFRIKGKDVDIRNQRYKALIKKGRTYTEVWKVIKDVARPFWELALAGCGKEDYVFSFGLKPGPEQADPDIINKIWRQLVIEDPGMGIAKKFYWLKHTHTTEVSTLLTQREAAEINSHTSLRMVQEVYDIDHSMREMNRVKTLDNPFA